VRNLQHPYHRSRLWLVDRAQLPDCRVNDVIRLAKTYLLFIRLCMNDKAVNTFDTAFLDRDDALSNLYWMAVTTLQDGKLDHLSQTATQEVLQISRMLRPGISELIEADPQTPMMSTSLGKHPRILSRLFGGSSAAVSRAVETELRYRLSLPAERARVYGLVSIMGYPQAPC
jgi:hypothetical protein